MCEHRMVVKDSCVFYRPALCISMFILHLPQSFFKSSLYPRGDNSEIVQMYRQLFNESLGKLQPNLSQTILG